MSASFSRLNGKSQEQGNYKQAEPLYQRALTIREKALGSEHPLVAGSLNNLAGLYRLQGNYKQAEPLHQRALAISEKVLGPEHPDVATSLNNLAELYWASGDIARTIQFQTRANNIQEHNLALNLTTGFEERKRAYIHTLSGITDATVSLHIQAAPNIRKQPASLLPLSYSVKGRVLDALTSSLLSVRQHLKPEDQALLDQLIALRSQLSALVFKGSGKTPPDQYRQQLTSLEDQAQKLEAKLSRRSDEFRTQSQPVTLEAVQKLIPADAALVELVLYRPLNPKATKPDERRGAARYVAYVLHSQGDPKWVDLGEAQTINQVVDNFRKAVRDRRLSTTEVKKVARTLDAELMQPIRQHLGNSRTILLSPDSQLNLIPFAALVDETNHYLVENYKITYLTSGRDLLRLQNQLNSQQSPVILANPDFDNSSILSVAVASSPGGIDNQRSTDLDLATQQWPRLPGTAEEAGAIAPLLPGVKVLTDSKATENALKQLHHPRILHIATHGFFLKDQPSAVTSPVNDMLKVALLGASANVTGTPENPLLRSGLVLAGANHHKSGNDDGILTALEAAGLDLRGTKLVVLSACETGLGDIADGEGVYGLRRAFVIAGAETQVISLWTVDDEGTKDLMVGYYQRLRNNVGRSEALRQIQLQMLHTQQYHLPYYWAAFIASGDWTSMGLASTLGR